MVTAKIGGVVLDGYIDRDGYDVRITPEYGNNGFVSSDGKEITDRLGDKISLSVNLIDVPMADAVRIANAVRDDTFSVTYTTPTEKSGEFKLTSYSASCVYADPDEKDPGITDDILWDISLTAESVVYSPGGL